MTATPATPPELLDDDAGWLSLQVKKDGEIVDRRVDVYEAFTLYADMQNNCTSDERDENRRQWAARVLGFEVSLTVANRLSHLVVGAVDAAKKKPAEAGSTGSGSEASRPETSDHCSV